MGINLKNAIDKGGDGNKYLSINIVLPFDVFQFLSFILHIDLF